MSPSSHDPGCTNTSLWGQQPRDVLSIILGGKDPRSGWGRPPCRPDSVCGKANHFCSLSVKVSEYCTRSVRLALVSQKHIPAPIALKDKKTTQDMGILWE